MSGRLIEFARKDDIRKVVPLAGFPGVVLSNTTLEQNLSNSQLQADSLELLARAVRPDAMTHVVWKCQFLPDNVW